MPLDQFLFEKPTHTIPTWLVADPPYQSLTKNYHYEVELVAALKSAA